MFRVGHGRAEVSQWIVEILPYGDDTSDPGYRKMTAQSEHDARKINRGANINLNHERYYTRVTGPDEGERK